MNVIKTRLEHYTLSTNNAALDCPNDDSTFTSSPKEFFQPAEPYQNPIRAPPIARHWWWQVCTQQSDCRGALVILQSILVTDGALWSVLILNTQFQYLVDYIQEVFTSIHCLHKTRITGIPVHCIIDQQYTRYMVLSILGSMFYSTQLNLVVQRLGMSTQWYWWKGCC